jgi:hypothetical protein
VRGGFLLMDQQAWVGGEMVRATNYQSPVSEGLWDSRYAFVAMAMLRDFQRRCPHAFIVGMGHIDRPLPRLLLAAGWSIRPIPFLFRIVRAAPVLRELAVFRRRRSVAIAASILAATGAARLGNALATARAIPARLNARGAVLDVMDGWGEWADDLWTMARASCSFAVLRTRAALEALYPAAGGRYRIYRMRRNGRVAGWAVAMRTAMNGHKDFGSLTVTTLLDAFAMPGAHATLGALVTEAAARDVTDLIITNQSHENWTRAFRQCGFLPGPSNYLLATSKPLTAAIAAGGGSSRVHVVRGDGVGRIHL